MKKISTILLLLTVSVLSFSQMVRNPKSYINTISYPYVLLEHNVYKINVQGLGVIEAHGYTFDDIEKRFSQTQSMKYTSETDTDYTVHISFENPAVKNEGIKRDSRAGGSAYFFGVGFCSVPVKMKITNRDGWEIIKEFYVFKSASLKGDSFSTEAEAKKHWATYLKNDRDKIVKSTVLKAINATINDFQSKHDYHVDKTTTTFYYYSPGRKFKEEGWEKNIKHIQQLCNDMSPTQTLIDYRDEIIPMITFFEEQHDLVKKKNHKIYALSNAAELSILIDEFDKLPKYLEMLSNLGWGGRTMKGNIEKRVEIINNRREIYLAKNTIDAERIELAKMKEAKRIEEEQKQYLLDSLNSKPSEIKVYYNNNKIWEGHGYINKFRPTYEKTDNIVEIGFGRHIRMTAVNSTQFIGNVSADEVKKIVAGEEILYPALFEGNKNLRFTYLIYECPKIRVLYFKNDILMQKTGDEVAEVFAPTLFGSMHNKLAEYFADCPELAQKLSNKEIDIDNRSDLIAIAKMYSAY
ncbi:MAG: hypothetical protein PF436_01430 [Prolixibacteraceae bacterium]|jgi:hypothetical protein|nr:hypothetical protein [Prolixibacteraceae bacterium]